MAKTTSRMARLVRVVTAAMLAVHVTVGCCAHHAHACRGEAHSSSFEGGATHDEQCCQSEADHAHHGLGQCQGSQCSFVSSTAPNSNSFAPSSLTLVTPLLDNQYSSVNTDSEQPFFAVGRLLPSVRLHLMNQILLI
jgi:hypothetical protein